MPRPLLRKTIRVALVAAVLVLGLILVLPFAASTRLVRDRISQELGAWSGYRVELGARPEIEVWPSLRAVLHDVRFSDWDADAPPVLQAERIEIEMSALAALRGEIDFNHLRLFEPLLRVQPAPSYGYLPTLPRGGRILRGVEAARRALKADPITPDINELPHRDFGTIEFAGARIVSDEAPGEREIATGLSGVVNWPAFNRGGALRAEGMWRGETISLDFASAQPLLHLAGGTTELRTVIRSAPLTASFDGTAGLSANAAIDGILQISTKSARQAASWLKLDLGSSMAQGAVEFSGALSGSAKRLKFANASVVLDGNTGIGGFDVALDGAVPAISGTLAFDVLDLPTMLAVFSPLLPQQSIEPAPPTPFIDRMKLDLRLSASTAHAGPVTLSEIAATAQVKPGLAVLDISDSRAFGGMVQAGLRADRTPGSETVDIRLLVSDVDGSAAGDSLGLQALVPASRGTLSLTLNGRGKTWEQVLESASGSFSARFAQGTLRAFNLDHFLVRLGQGGFFAWKDVTDGALPVEGVEVKATMEAGVARISSASVNTPQRSLVLQGIVPYVGGLALSGSVVQRPPAGDPQQPTPPADPALPLPLPNFFVGGSWNAPFISSTAALPVPN